MKSLNNKQKATRMGIDLEYLMWYERQGDKFLDCIVNGYGSWCLHYDPETKCMSQQWKHPSPPRLKKDHAIPTAGKVKLTLFFDCRRPWLIDWLPYSIIVNANHFAETLEQLRSTIKTNRPSMLSWAVILLHDNARPHS